MKRVIETKHYRYKQTEFTTQVEWLFDKAGYLIKQIETDDNGLVIGHIEMLYEDEKPLKVRRKSNDGIISEIKYSYDQDGNLVEYTESENHVLQSITKHTIDNHGKLVAVSEFDSTGTLLEQKDYHYNEQGLLSAVSSIYDTVNGTYEYDQAGNLIKQLTKQIDGPAWNIFMKTHLENKLLKVLR